MAGVFDAKSLLEQEGYKLTSVVDDGVYNVVGADGSEGTLDLNEMLKAQNIDPKTIEFEVNDPSAPIQVSAVGLLDRAKLSFGNAKGKLNYLKNRFQDVKYNPDQGLVVKNKGAWQIVDPKGLGEGDAWDLTKELAADVLDLGDVAVGVAGSSAGAAAGLGAASIPGAAAGGAAAGAINTSLGRLVGTYDATPEEQLKDIGWEALLNMGGQTIGLGVKAGLNPLKNALKDISKHAVDGSKNIIAETIGRVTGTGSQAALTAIENADDVVKELGRASVGKTSADAVVEGLRTAQLADAQRILESAGPALSKRFGQLKSSLVENASNMGPVKVGGLVTESLEDLANVGLLKRTAQNEAGQFTYDVMDDAAAVALRNQGKEAAILADNVREQIAPLVKQLNTFTKLGEFKGKAAASALMDIKKTLNDVLRDSVGDSSSPVVKDLAGRVKKAFATRVGEQFEKSGLTSEYLATSNVYEQFADAVSQARKLAAREGGAEQFVKKLVSDSSANRSLKDMAGTLADLLGEDGTKTIQNIAIKDAARAFSTWLPKSGLMASGGVTTGVGAALGGVPGALAGAAVSSPKLALSAINYGTKGLKLLQSMNPIQRREFLADPKMLDTFFRTVTVAPMMQQQITEGLVQQTTGQKAGQ